MKRLYTKCLLLFALSVCSVIANAQTLSVESIEANTGEQAELVVSASGMSGVTALQFNLALPQSVTLNVSAITKGSAVSSHELKVEKKANGEYLFVLYHLDLGLVSNGTLLKLPITTGQQSGSLGGNLNTIRTASADAVSHNCADASFNITVKAPVVPVTITANNLTMVYGDDVPTLTYTSEGGALNGTPKLSTTATKTSPVGTYPIKVEKGTVTNEAVTYIAGTLTITQAPLTVGVQDVTMTEGDAIPSFTLTYSGFRNGDTEANAFTTKPTVTTTATSSSKAGTYPITVSGGSATNYALTYTQGTLTITEKPVEPATVTANNLTMVYGDDVPTLTYTSEGGALNGTPKLSTTATKTSPVGTYPIKVEKGTVTNETVTYVAGTLTITQAPLTVGVQNVTITEGDAIPSFTLTYSGFRNGDTESNAFTTKPTATTTATSSSKAGTYPITVSGGSATNYALTYTQGTLTITEKPVEPATVTANNLTMVYGDDVPTLTYTSEGGALNGTPKLSTTATKTSPVGTYPIKVEKGTVTNEAVTYVDGTLTITQAPLTVGVQNVTIKEGDAIPSFTLTYSGFRNGDTESNAFSTKPTATTTATSSSKAGTYPITISGGTATNYALTYTQGTLTITEKPVEPATVTANNLTMVYGDDVPTLTYTSEGGALNGTPKLSTTATKTSPVGTYPIKAEKGTVTNEAVTYVAGTLTITQAPLTVGVQNVTITEGDAIPSFTLTYSGFRNGDTESNAFSTKPTATTMATASSKAGTYTITVSGGSATNYALSYTQGTLTITEKPVEPATVTANNLTMVYGDDMPTLTFTSEGGALNGTPKLSTTATKTSPVGTYPIKVEKGTVTNEAVTYIAGTLTITQAPLTVGVQNVTITEGDAIPSFTLTYSGFRNGDTESNAFSTKPTATTMATASSKAGIYPITVSGGEATNYSLTYTQGTLTIKEKESTTSWTNIVVNSDLEGNDVSCFYKRENYAESETVVSATIDSHSGKDSSRGIAVKSVDNPSGNWNTQFFVRLPQTIPAGTKYRLSFDYKANQEAYVLMEIHAEPSEYIFYDFDHMTFTPSWQHYESEGTITEEMSTDENKMRTLAFDLAHETTATTYYFDNIIFEIEESQVEQPVIITANDQTMIYGDDVPTLTYKSSGATLSGTPKMSTTATKTSPVGTYPIKVEKGTVTNEAVTYVEGTLTITQAQLTVGVQNVTITEGDAIPSFTLTYSGFRNGDTEANAFSTKPTATTTATSSSKAGTYPITVNGGSAKNYALTYQQGTLTIQKKSVEPVTITADNKTMTYGDDVPTLTYRSSGAALNGTPKLSTTATKTSPVGTYPIKVEKGTVTNEAVTYVDGTLTITQAPLTVGVQNVTITEGDAIPSFTLTYSGFRNGDTDNAFSTKPTATTTATSSSKAGIYPITVSGGTATNYALTYTQGTLTIKEKPGDPVTITANEITMIYGDEVPTLTYSTEGGVLKGTPKLSTTATKTSPAGSYPIKVERGTVTNEKVTFVDGTLIISKAPLTIGVKDEAITEGDAIPTFTLTYDGWRNGDTEATAFTRKPTAKTTATSESKAGTYPITITMGTAKNYKISYQEGTLTIKEKEVVATWTNIVQNGDLEGSDLSCFYMRENYAVDNAVVPATIVNRLGKNNSRGIMVRSVDNPADTWNTQFFVRLPQTIPAGTRYRLSFDYKASQEAYVLMEIHAEPNEFIYYDFGNMTCNISWRHYESEGTITGEMSTDENMMRTIVFDLAHEKKATKYYFDNIVFEIPSTSAINTVNADYRRNAAVFSLSGQKLSKPQKGINIINGKKVVVK